MRKLFSICVEAGASAALMKNYFLVALHGSSKRSLMNGYRISRVKKGRPPEDFINGFQQGGAVYGRPAGMLKIAENAFLFSDDFSGVIYAVYKKNTPSSVAFNAQTGTWKTLF